MDVQAADEGSNDSGALSSRFSVVEQYSPCSSSSSVGAEREWRNALSAR